jgi:hypothetical protein
VIFQYIDKPGKNHSDIKEYASSEKEIKVLGERCGAVRLRRTTVIIGICCGQIMALFYFDDYTNIDNFCFWLGKVLYQNCVRSKWSSWITLHFVNPLAFGKSSNMSIVNRPTYRPIRRTWTPLSIIRLGSTINFYTFGVMLLIFMIDFPLLLILIIRLPLCNTR